MGLGWHSLVGTGWVVMGWLVSWVGLGWVGSLKTTSNYGSTRGAVRVGVACHMIDYLIFYGIVLIS